MSGDTAQMVLLCCGGAFCWRGLSPLVISRLIYASFTHKIRYVYIVQMLQPSLPTYVHVMQ